MGRIHSHKHGKSQQTRPTSKTAPGFVTYGADEVKALVLKMAKEGVSSSMIGITLRDEYGVPLVKPIVGKSISEILKEGKATPPMPQDLADLIARAGRVVKHLQVHGSDRTNVHSLELIEAKIYRISNYYKERGLLPADFKYKTVVAQLA